MLIESIAGITPSGAPIAFFESFPKKGKGREERPNPKRVSIVHGMNGAGKSTIARSLSQTGETKEDSPTARFYGYDTKTGEVQLTNIPNVRVFNEDYIDLNFKEKTGQDEVQSIIMIGDQVSLDQEISSLETDIEDTTSNLDQAIQKREEQKKVEDEKKREMLTMIRDGGWRETEIAIHGKTKNATEKIVESIIATELDSEDGYRGNKQRLEDDIAAIVKARELSKLHGRIPFFDNLPNNEDLQSFFDMVVEKKSGGDLIRRINSLLSDEYSTGDAAELRDTFLSSSSEVCPVCVQKVPDDHKHDVIDAFTTIYNDDAKQVEERARELCIELEFAISSDVKALLGETTLRQVEESYSELNNRWKQAQLKINKKKASPYLDLELDTADLFSALEVYNRNASAANKDIERHNSIVDDAASRQKNASARNLSCARYEYSAIIDSISRARTERGSAQSIERVENQKLDGLKRRHAELIAKQSNVGIAASVINQFLSNIFGDVSRLQVETNADSGYKVLSRGVYVKPGRLSTGERNAISLAYFFTSCMEGKSVRNGYEDHQLVVLDDPLSSFDHENKYGVFNLVREVSENLCANNSMNQIIILTHDLGIAFDFASVFRTIDGLSCVASELRNEQLNRIAFPDKYSNYRAILSKMYSFARQEDVGEQGPSGNEIRLLFEAFCEFEYGEDISKVLTNELVRERISGNSIATSTYFSGPVYKLFLHGESHSSEAVRSGKFSLGPVYGAEDRRRICRDVLSLMYILNPDHVLSSLIDGGAERSTAVASIHDWQEALENSAMI